MVKSRICRGRANLLATLALVAPLWAFGEAGASCAESDEAGPGDTDRPGGRAGERYSFGTGGDVYVALSDGLGREERKGKRGETGSTTDQGGECDVSD